ncbi:hypothetical protein [Enterococcus sp. LJL51]|uniref:hypothetical protein n=1 Tax=Enterococcus sp. LJL51 TaxID=3416656 RepID=UPI003CFAE9EE
MGEKHKRKWRITILGLLVLLLLSGCTEDRVKAINIKNTEVFTIGEEDVNKELETSNQTFSNYQFEGLTFRKTYGWADDSFILRLTKNYRDEIYEYNTASREFTHITDLSLASNEIQADLRIGDYLYLIVAKEIRKSSTGYGVFNYLLMTINSKTKHVETREIATLHEAPLFRSIGFQIKEGILGIRYGEAYIDEMDYISLDLVISKEEQAQIELEKEKENEIFENSFEVKLGNSYMDISELDKEEWDRIEGYLWKDSYLLYIPQKLEREPGIPDDEESESVYQGQYYIYNYRTKERLRVAYLSLDNREVVKMTDNFIMITPEDGDRRLIRLREEEGKVLKEQIEIPGTEDVRYVKMLTTRAGKTLVLVNLGDSTNGNLLIMQEN